MGRLSPWWLVFEATRLNRHQDRWWSTIPTTPVAVITITHSFRALRFLGDAVQRVARPRHFDVSRDVIHVCLVPRGRLSETMTEISCRLDIARRPRSVDRPAEFDPGLLELLHMRLHRGLLAREIFQCVVAIVLVIQRTLAQAFRLVLHLLDDRGLLLRVLGQEARILRIAAHAVDHVRFDDGRVGLRREVFPLHAIFPFQKFVVGRRRRFRLERTFLILLHHLMESFYSDLTMRTSHTNGLLCKQI